MAKLKDAPISDKDLADFATTSSDFGFEMQVLARLRAEGFSYSHAGTYRDPVKDRFRQFERESQTSGWAPEGSFQSDSIAPGPSHAGGHASKAPSSRTGSRAAAIAASRSSTAAALG